MNGAKRTKLKATGRGLALCAAALLLAACGSGSDDPRATSCAASRILKVGFYSDFRPVSYSQDRFPNSSGFDIHLGYEADLLTALESLEGAGLTFNRRGIGDPFAGIWLKAALPAFDIVGGGITIREDRTLNAAGETAIVFTSGHISFVQTLLTRSEDAERLDSHDKLGSADRVGAVPETTGEERLLQLTGLTGEGGVLAAGVEVSLASGERVTADGSELFFITAAGESANVEGRVSLTPADPSMPQVIYFEQEAAMLAALRAFEIDAVARGNIGNSDVAAESEGALAVAARDPERVERGGFALDVADAPLATCLDEKINLLTDNGRLDYADWRANPDIFLERARMF